MEGFRPSRRDFGMDVEQKGFVMLNACNKMERRQERFVNCPHKESKSIYLWFRSDKL